MQNANHNFNGGGLLWIFLEWTVAPFIACVFAYCLFTVLKASVLCHEKAEKRILIFLPISYGISAGLLCLFVMYQVFLRPLHCLFVIFNNLHFHINLIFPPMKKGMGNGDTLIHASRWSIQVPTASYRVSTSTHNKDPSKGIRTWSF